jgi:Undecaprenyl-phosphate glucose phosphotransferase
MLSDHPLAHHERRQVARTPAVPAGGTSLTRLSPQVLRDTMMSAGPLLVAVAGPVAFATCEALAEFAGVTDPGLLAVQNQRYLTISLLGALLYTLIERAGRRSDWSHPWRGTGPADATRAWLLTMIVLVMLGMLAQPDVQLSKLWVLVWFGMVLVILPATHWAVGLLLGRLAMTGRLGARRIAIVGATEQARHLLLNLSNTVAGDTPHRVVGIFDDRLEPHRIPAGIMALAPLSGTVADLVALGRRETIDAIVIALPHYAVPRVRQLASTLRSLPADLLLCPDLIGAANADGPRPNVLLGGLQFPALYRQPHKDWGGLVKWLEDKLIASLVLLALSWVMLLVALAIRLDSKGPIFFRQPRFGFNNQPFHVLKFRTMYHHLGDVTGARRTVRSDPRVTQIGRFLRRTSLDELPQLINVLRGDMSIVGPRPHPIEMKVLDRLYYEAVKTYPARHRVKPGLTGLAQVNGLRGEVDTLEKAQRRVEFDLQYIERWSLSLDLKIMMLTLTRGLLSTEAR